MNRRDLAIALLVVTIWGANFTVIRIGLDGVPPMLLASLRFFLAAFPAILFVRRPAVGLHYWLAYGLSVGVGQFGCCLRDASACRPGWLRWFSSRRRFSRLSFTVLLLHESVSIGSAGLYSGRRSVPGGSVSGKTVPSPALLTIAFRFLEYIEHRCPEGRLICRFPREKLDMLNLVVWSALVPPLPLFLFSLLLDSPATVTSGSPPWMRFAVLPSTLPFCHDLRLRRLELPAFRHSAMVAPCPARAGGGLLSASSG
jgi:O-acetylserine/cysteine efflux transporter